MKHTSLKRGRCGSRGTTKGHLKPILEGAASKKEIAKMLTNLIAYCINVLKLPRKEARAHAVAAVEAHYQTATEFKGVSKNFESIMS